MKSNYILIESNQMHTNYTLKSSQARLLVFSFSYLLVYMQLDVLVRKDGNVRRLKDSIEQTLYHTLTADNKHISWYFSVVLIHA